MAKKSTTGGPRSRKVTEADLQRRSTYRSRAELERMWQKRAAYAIFGLIAIGLLLLLFGILFEQVIRPSQAISTVNGVEISTGDFEKRVAFERWQVADQIREYYAITGGNFNLYGEQIAQELTNQVNSLANPVVFGSPVLDRLEEQILLEQAVNDRGLTVDQDAIEREVDQYIASFEGLALPDPDAEPTSVPTVTPTPLVSPTPTMTRTPTPEPTQAPTEEGATEEATEEAETTPFPTATTRPTLTSDEIYATVESAADTFYEDAIEGASVDRDVVFNAFYYDALVEVLRADLAEEVETSELQVNARHILISFTPGTQPGQAPPPTDEEKQVALEKAESVMDALSDGESFASLAEVHSDDPGSGANGGELGWASPSNYVAAFKDTVETAEIGAIVGPVETEFGYHIIQVLGREVRELSPSELDQRRNAAFNELLNELRANAEIERREDWIDRIPGKPTYNELLGDIIPR